MTDRSKVYFTADISPAGLARAAEALGRTPTGRVAVKISTGEPGPRGGNWLAPALIADYVAAVGGVIVEANTGYPGRRQQGDQHYQVAVEHGYTAIAEVDILDAEGEASLPVRPGGHLSEDIVGSHYSNYDFYVVLSHFKGHGMGGFGGAVKNISIGLASSAGKLNIHSAGTSTTDFSGSGTHEGFLESMAEAGLAVADSRGESIVYLNVMNNISVDCDCDGNAAPPDMADIGVLSSLDPVALDKACVDLVYAAPDGQSVVERIESLQGLLTLRHAAAIGLGSLDYELIDLD
ncbi:MAG: DUF362 domain-containing protein [Propionibacteriaceae bacterium]|jgi:uncharacterized Fe-S center protein|nr:DUF362 domain-containing protein [Propionibacteriaceae bacterium]